MSIAYAGQAVASHAELMITTNNTVAKRFPEKVSRKKKKKNTRDRIILYTLRIFILHKYNIYFLFYVIKNNNDNKNTYAASILVTVINTSVYYNDSRTKIALDQPC